MALPFTYRLGATTAKAISSLCAFPFESRRPDRVLTGRDGLPFREIESIEVPESDISADIPTLRLVTNRATTFVGAVVAETIGVLTASTKYVPAMLLSSSPTTRRGLRWKPCQEAPPVKASMSGLLAASRVGNGTLSSRSDPPFGKTSAGEHQLSLGRPCVMAFRHMTHLTWVLASNWQSVLNTASEESEDAITGAKVRRALTRG